MKKYMVSPSKCLKHLKMHFPQMQAKYPDINLQMLKSATVYELLTLEYLIKYVPLPDNEIRLVRLGNLCLTHKLECLLGKHKCCPLHSTMHDVFGRFYNEHMLRPGYGNALNEIRAPKRLKTCPLLGHVSGLIWSIHSRNRY